MKVMLGTWLLWGLATAAKQPNILFILTDDQGKLIGGLDHMPRLQVCLRFNPSFSPASYSKLYEC